MSKLKIFFCVLLSLIIINSCTSGQSNKYIPAKECIELNNQGVKYLMNYPMNGDTELNKAISLFKQAIKCDSICPTAYINLATAYDRKHSYIEEMSVFNKLLPLVNNYPTILMEKGMLFERMDKVDSAKKTYYLAGTELKGRLTKYPSNVSLIDGIIELKALTIGAGSAIEELNKQIKMYPELSSQLSYEYTFYKNFDRHAFVFRLTTQESGTGSF